MRKIITHSDSADIQCCVALLTSIFIYTYMYTDGADHSGLNSYLLNMMKIYKCLVNCT